MSLIKKIGNLALMGSLALPVGCGLGSYSKDPRSGFFVNSMAEGIWQMMLEEEEAEGRKDAAKIKNEEKIKNEAYNGGNMFFTAKGYKENPKGQWPLDNYFGIGEPARLGEKFLFVSIWEDRPRVNFDLYIVSNNKLKYTGQSRVIEAKKGSMGYYLPADVSEPGVYIGKYSSNGMILGESSIEAR